MKTLVVATVQMHHPTLNEDEKRFDSPKPLFNQVLAYIKQAVSFKSDIICLPETFANFNRSQHPEDTAELMDGKIMTFLAQQSKKPSLGLVTTAYIKEKKQIFNTGVAFNKKGMLVGR